MSAKPTNPRDLSLRLFSQPSFFSLRRTLFGACGEVELCAPCGPIGEQVAGAGRGAGVFAGSFLDPLAEAVLVVEILLGGGLHGLGDLQAPCVSGDCAFDRPAQDCRPFRPQLLGQLWVALVFRDLHREGNEGDAASDGFVDAREAGL